MYLGTTKIGVHKKLEGTAPEWPRGYRHGLGSHYGWNSPSGTFVVFFAVVLHGVDAGVCVHCWLALRLRQRNLRAFLLFTDLVCCVSVFLFGSVIPSHKQRSSVPESETQRWVNWNVKRFLWYSRNEFSYKLAKRRKHYVAFRRNIVFCQSAKNIQESWSTLMLWMNTYPWSPTSQNFKSNKIVKIMKNFAYRLFYIMCSKN